MDQQKRQPKFQPSDTVCDPDSLFIGVVFNSPIIGLAIYTVIDHDGSLPKLPDVKPYLNEYDDRLQKTSPLA